MDQSLLPEMTSTLAVILSLAGGAILCFFGFRLLKIAVGIVGFMLGASLASGLTSWVSEGSRSVTIAALVVGGILGAVILVWSVKVGIFLVGALAGALMGGLVAGLLFGDGSVLVTVLLALVMGLVGGVAAIRLQRLVLGIATAVIGSALIITSGLEALLGQSRAQEIFSRVSGGLTGLDTESALVLAGWIALAAAGAAVQLSRKRKA